MTPAEGALYLGIPNLPFIRYEGKPEIEEFNSYAVSFKPFKKGGLVSGRRPAERPEMRNGKLFLALPKNFRIFADS